MMPEDLDDDDLDDEDLEEEDLDEDEEDPENALYYDTLEEKNDYTNGIDRLIDSYLGSG